MGSQKSISAYSPAKLYQIYNLINKDFPKPSLFSNLNVNKQSNIP
jgi:hypothetical protein